MAFSLYKKFQKLRTTATYRHFCFVNGNKKQNKKTGVTGLCFGPIGNIFFT